MLAAVIDRAAPGDPVLLLANGVLLLVLAAGVVMGIRFLLRLNARKGRPWHRGCRVLRGRPVGWMAVVALLAAVFLLQILLLATSLWWLPRIARGPLSEEMVAVLVGGVAMHGVVILLVWMALSFRGASWTRYFGSPAGGGWVLRAGQGVGGYLMALPLVALSAWLWQRGLTAAGIEIVPQEVMRLVLEAEPWWMRGFIILLAVGIAPVAEELFFRGILLPPLSRGVGVVAAVVGSSLLFAAIHIHLAALVPIFVLSLACALAYIHTASLTVPIVLHAVFNGVSVVLFILSHHAAG